MDLQELEKICDENRNKIKQSRRILRQQEEDDEEVGDEEEQTSETQQPDSSDNTQGNIPRLTEDTLDASQMNLVNDETRKLKDGGKKGGKESSSLKEMNKITSGK